jgi:hypothetical protein
MFQLWAIVANDQNLIQANKVQQNCNKVVLLLEPLWSIWVQTCFSLTLKWELKVEY